MNCANFRRNLSDSWLTFTTNLRDRLSLRFARWSFSIYGDQDPDEWLDSVARNAARQPFKGRWYRMRSGDRVKPSEVWERKENMAVVFKSPEEFDKWNRGLNPALLEHVKATKDE